MKNTLLVIVVLVVDGCSEKEWRKNLVECYDAHEMQQWVDRRQKEGKERTERLKQKTFGQP